MPAADGLLVRVKPPGARLSSGAARRLADAAARHGNGTIELTSRANLQVRGLSEASAVVFAAEMVAAGLAVADAGIERRRTVMALPLGGDDPGAAADAAPLAAALEAMLAADPALAALPPKFGFAVDGGGVLPLTEPADIVVRSDGASHRIGIGAAEAACAPDRTVAHVRALAHAAGSRRMSDVVREDAAAAVLARVGLIAVAAIPRTASLPTAPSPTAPSPTTAESCAGFVAYPGGDTGAFVLAVPVGQLDAATLAAVADLADRFGRGELRTSPWRALLLGTVRAADAAAVRDAAAASGLIVDPADRRLRMAACIGSAGCASGTVPAREAALALAAGRWTGLLHVSGCAKGCAHPRAAALTLVGEGGRFNLVRDGRADGVPAMTGLAFRDAVREIAR